MDLLVVDGAIDNDDDDDDDDDGYDREGENDQTGGFEDDDSGSSTEEEDGRWNDHEAPAHRLVGRRGVREAHQGRGQHGAGDEI